MNSGKIIAKWRVAATIIAVAALAGLIVPVRWVRRVKVEENREGVYLTEGYDVDSVKMFLATHRDLAGIWGEPGVVGDVVAEAPGSGERGSSRGGEGEGSPDGGKWPVARLHVFGYGLTGKRWAALGAPELVLHGGRQVEGVVRVEWQRQLYSGERLVVHGSWLGGVAPGSRGKAQGDAGPVKMLLSGLGSTVDSAIVTGGDFMLGVVPAALGRVEYELMAVRGRDTLEREVIPVEVGRGLPMNILILAASPGFENAFLVNWLIKNGQRAAIRVTVSKGRYQSSFINMAPRPLDRLTASLLDSFDVVIADSAAVQVSGEGAWSVFKRQVEEKGLGLIVRMDSGFIRKGPGIRVIRADSLLRTVVGAGLAGVGKLIHSSWNATYVQQLSGQSGGYSSYWAGLLRLAGRTVVAGDSWRLAPDEPRAGEEAQVLLQTRVAAPQAVVHGVSVYLAEDEVLDFIWRGSYWPDSAGWVEIGGLSGDSNWVYVWARGDWAALKRGARLRETMGYHGAQKKIGPGVDHEEKVGFPRPWLYATFLLCVYFLWVERKFF